MSCTFLTFLKPDEQLVLEGPSSISVVNGPAAAWHAPIINSARKRKALQLEEQQYATIKDTLTGKVRVEVGPSLNFLGPYDEHVGTHDKVVLLNHQYARLVDASTASLTSCRLHGFYKSVHSSNKLSSHWDQSVNHLIITTTAGARHTWDTSGRFDHDDVAFTTPTIDALPGSQVHLHTPHHHQCT